VRALGDAASASLRGGVLDRLGWLRILRRPAGRIECAREALAVADAVGDRFQMSAAAGLSNMEPLAGRPRPEVMARPWLSRTEAAAKMTVRRRGLPSAPLSFP
jgi:hypothetical protein